MKKILNFKLLASFIIAITTIFLVNSVIDDKYLIAYSTLIGIIALYCIFKIHNKIINTLFVFSVFYFALLLFGPIILYKEGYNYYREVGNLIIISYICFTIGYNIFGLLRFHKKPTNCYKNTAKTVNEKTLYFISVIIFTVGILSYAIYFLGNWHNIFGSDLEEGRVEAMTGNGLLLWVGSLVWLSVYMTYEQYLKDGKHKRTVLLMIIASAAFSILLGFRSALVNPILIIFFMKNKKKEIPIVKMFGVAVVLFIFVGVYGAIRSGSGESSVVSIIRELKVSSVNINYIVATFPKRVKYQHGMTYLLDIITLFSNKVEGNTTWLKNVLGLKFSGGGVTPTIIGEFYINWGLPGVLIGMTASGALFKRIDYLYKKPDNSAFLSCLILGYIRPIIRGGYANSLVNLFVYYIGYLICQKISQKIRIV